MNKHFQPGEIPYLPSGADGEAQASAKVEMEIGKLISGTVQRFLRTIAFSTDCELQMDVDKGWLTDSIRIRVTGTGRSVVAFANKLEAYSRHLPTPSIQSHDCDIAPMVTGHTRKLAVEKWNTRAKIPDPSTAIVKAREALEAVVKTDEQSLAELRVKIPSYEPSQEMLALMEQCREALALLATPKEKA